MKRAWIAIILVCIALAGVVGWQVVKPSDEPVYEGRKLTSWLRDHWQVSEHSVYENGETVRAVRQIGTNAIPTLLSLIRARDSGLKLRAMNLLRRQHVIELAYSSAESKNWDGANGFDALGSMAEGAVPELAKIAERNVSATSRLAAIRSLGLIGHAARPAVPYLIQLVKEGSADVASGAYWSVARIDPAALAKAGITNAP